MATPPRLVIGISGATGIAYGVRILEVLRPLPVETHLVMSKTAEQTMAMETDLKTSQIRDLADAWYRNDDFTAAIASGSFRTLGMIIAPCSVRSMSEIATGATSSLLTRAADVTLKECRRVVLMVRETPLHAGHLRNMATLADLGAVIAPPVPAFYTKPASIADIIDHTVGRVLDLFDMEVGIVKRWGEADTRRRPG